MGSDESKSENKKEFIWLEKIFLWSYEDGSVVSFEVCFPLVFAIVLHAEMVCKDFQYLNGVT